MSQLTIGGKTVEIVLARTPQTFVANMKTAMAENDSASFSRYYRVMCDLYGKDRANSLKRQALS